MSIIQIRLMIDSKQCSNIVIVQRTYLNVGMEEDGRTLLDINIFNKSKHTRTTIYMSKSSCQYFSPALSLELG